MKKNFIYNSIYQIMLIFMPLLTTPYLSRVLGSEAIGIYSYNYSIAYYFSIFILLGLNTYGNRGIARVSSKSRKTLSKEFWSMYAMQFLLGCIVIVTYIVYSLFISKNSNVSLIFIIYVLSAMFDINWFYFGLELFKITVIRNLIIKFISVFLLFTFIKNQSDLYLYCFLMCLSFFLTQMPLWIILNKFVDFYPPALKEIRKHIVPNSKLFLSVLGVSLYKYMDKIMLGIFSSMYAVGIYEQAEKIINLPIALIVSLGTVMLPRMTNIYEKNSKVGEKYFEKSIIFSVLSSSVLCFGIISVRKIFIPIFYGPGYEAINDLYLILLPSCIFLAVGNVITTQYLIPLNKDTYYIKSIFLGAFINLIINFVLISKLQYLGVAIGTLCAEASVCLYKVYICSRDFNIYKFIFKSMPALISSLIMWCIVGNLPYESTSIVVLFFHISIGCFIFIIVYSLFCLVWKKISNRKL